MLAEIIDDVNDPVGVFLGYAKNCRKGDRKKESGINSRALPERAAFQFLVDGTT